MKNLNDLSAAERSQSKAKNYRIHTSNGVVESKGTSLLNAMMNSPYPASEFKNVIKWEVIS